MIFLSSPQEADVRALVAAWLSRQDSALQNRLSGWLDEMFYAALEFVLDAQADVVERTKMGVVQTGLSHLGGVSSKSEFCVGLIRGLGCNLPLDKRTLLATKVWSLSGSEKPVDARAPLDCTWDRATGKLVPYSLRESGVIALEDISFRAPPVVHTIDVQRNRDQIMPWLQDMRPFLLVGPDGCGRTLLLEESFRALKHATVATIHCSAQTNAQHVIQKLNDHCTVYSTNKGRVYRPKEGERLVLFLKDLNLPRPDKYDTIQLIAFLQQLITYEGFYDDNLDWVGIEKIQLVMMAGTGGGAGRHALSTRFTATVHVAYMVSVVHFVVAQLQRRFVPVEC
jgi:dynein heavy chain 2